MPTPDEYRRAVAAAGGNRAQAARALDVHRRTIYDACERYGIPYVDSRYQACPARYCEVCESEIPRHHPGGRRRSVGAYARARFCGSACFGAWRARLPVAASPRVGLLAMECTTCGCEVRRRPSATGVYYCSNACKRRRITRSCVVCGAPVTRVASRMERTSDKTCCSPACLGRLNAGAGSPAA